MIREFADQKRPPLKRVRVWTRSPRSPRRPRARHEGWSSTGDGPQTGGRKNGKLTRDGRHLLRYDEKQRAFELVEISTGAVRRLTTDGPNPAEASRIVGGTVRTFHRWAETGGYRSNLKPETRQSRRSNERESNSACLTSEAAATGRVARHWEARS